MSLRNSAQAVQRAFYAFWRLLYKPGEGSIWEHLRQKFPGQSGEAYTKAVGDGEQLLRIWNMSQEQSKPAIFREYAPPEIGQQGNLKGRFSVGWTDSQGNISSAKSRIQYVNENGLVGDYENSALQWLVEDRGDNDTITIGSQPPQPTIVGWIIWYE